MSDTAVHLEYPTLPRDTLMRGMPDPCPCCVFMGPAKDKNGAFRVSRIPSHVTCADCLRILADAENSAAIARQRAERDKQRREEEQKRFEWYEQRRRAQKEQARAEREHKQALYEVALLLAEHLTADELRAVWKRHCDSRVRGEPHEWGSAPPHLNMDLLADGWIPKPWGPDDPYDLRVKGREKDRW